MSDIKKENAGKHKKKKMALLIGKIHKVITTFNYFNC